VTMEERICERDEFYSDVVKVLEVRSTPKIVERHYSIEHLQNIYMLLNRRNV